jgi:predicted SAM-dependent methyltransferase
MKEVIFHIDLDSRLQSDQPLILELGCGLRQKPERIGIDVLDLPGIDIVADLNAGLPFLPDNSVDEIHSKSLLEHIDHLELLMGEIWRVLKPGGKKHLFVPHFSNPYYYSDYTHQRFFGLYTFEYFSKSQTRYQRKVPNFYVDYSFKTEFLRLTFNAQWRLSRPFRRLMERVVNHSANWQEIYEENWCYWIPCYGIQAILSPEK